MICLKLDFYINQNINIHLNACWPTFRLINSSAVLIRGGRTSLYLYTKLCQMHIYLFFKKNNF